MSKDISFTGRKILQPEHAVSLVPEELRSSDKEHFLILHLSEEMDGRLLQHASTGTDVKVSIAMHDIFRRGIVEGTACLIMMHTHPEEDDNPIPSPADYTLSEKALRASMSVRMPILDHIVVSKRSFYSIATEDDIFQMPVEGEGYLHCIPVELYFERKNGCLMRRTVVKRNRKRKEK